MSSLDLLFPELESTAGQISDLLDEAQNVDDQSSVFNRQVSPEGGGEEWQFGVALHQIPMYQLQRLSKNLGKELQRARALGSSSNLRALGSQSPAGSEQDLTRLRKSPKRERPTTRKTPFDEFMGLIGLPARYLFREMWLWSERDLVLFLVVAVFLVEVYIGWQYFVWSPMCLLYPLLSSSSGSRVAADLQEELLLQFAPQQKLARRMNIPVAIQVLVCHNMLGYLLVMLVFFGGTDPLYGVMPKMNTFLFAGLLWVMSMIGMVGTNLVWACRTISLSLPQKVALMMCNSVANQGSIFRWARNHRAHLKHRGTDADPYDQRRGPTYSYIGWFVLHKTPRIIEATRSLDVSDLLTDQVVMFQADVDTWWNLSACHALPAFATLLWGEELFLGWVICGCARYVFGLHANLLLVYFQHRWGPVKISPKPSTSTDEAPSDAQTVQQEHEQRQRKREVSMLRSASVADVGGLAAMAAEKKEDSAARGRPTPIDLRASAAQGHTSEDGGGVIVKYKVNESTPGSEPSLEVKLEPLWKRSTLVDLAVDAVTEILKKPPGTVRPDVPLMDLGFDSVGALRLRDKLSRRLKVELPPTLLFDHPTINAMVDRGLAQVAQRPMTPTLLQAEKASPAPEVCIVSTACSLPGAQGLQGYWEMLSRRADSVVEVPLARWNNMDYYDPDGQEGKTYARHGGFIEGAHLFDASFFGLAAAEAKATDPQQRLLLTTSYHALRGNCYDKHVLQGSRLGVYVALSNLDWYQMSLPKASVYTGTGVSSAIAANRVSYVFGVKGPSMTIDTACSSSLSALSSALTNLAAGSSLRESLVAGSELLHGPNSLVLRSVAGMLSRVGRCKTFNATADGYIRGEGCGAALLKPIADAEEGRSEIVVELKSAVMNQDGKSATLTAPNGPSQEEVILLALRQAQLKPSSVNAVECHGTGTALGDPIEVGALKSVLGESGARVSEMYLCAGKSNTGHLEGAAGFAGLLKVAGCLQNH